MTKIPFPVKYFEGNLIFSHNGSVWAGYRLPDRHYEYRSESDQLALHEDLEGFYWNIKAETQAMMVPRFQRVEEPFHVFRQRLAPELKETGTKYIQDCLKMLKGREVSQYQYYMFVKLKEAQMSGSFWRRMTFAAKDFKRYLTDQSGVGAPEIFEEEIEAYKLQEELVLDQVQEYLEGERIDIEEIQWLIRRGFYRGIGEVPLRQGWQPKADSVEAGGKKARRPRDREILTLSEGIFNDRPGRHLEVEQVVQGEPRKGFMSFLTLSHFPEERGFPGTEWLLWLNRLPYGVEASIRTKHLDHRKSIGKVRAKKKELSAETEHAEESGVSPSLQLLESQEEADQLEGDLSREKFPIIETSVLLCVSAPTERELKQRVQAVQNLYSDELFQLELPFGDQWRGFNEMIPGSDRLITDYLHFVEPATVAASMIGFSRQLGDGEGAYLGDSGHQPVFFLHDRGPKHEQLSDTGSAVFVGKTGKGKSLLAKSIIYDALLMSAMGIVFDPKDEWHQVLTHLPELQGITRIVTLRAIEEDRGKLDPLMGAARKELVQAGETAKQILQFLARTVDGTYESTVIGKAVDDVVLEARQSEEKPSMMKVLHQLQQRMTEAPSRRKERLEEIWEVLQYQANSGQTQLLFGDGSQQPIELSQSLTVLQVEGLRLPQSNETDYDRMGLAVMMAISDFCRRFSDQPSDRFKFVFFDEAWRLAKVPEGKEIVEELIRTGRSKNSAIYIASQSASKDLMGDEIKMNVGYQFVFGARNPQEAEAACELLGIEVNDDNIKKIANLPAGVCLMSDLEGRVNELNVNVVQDRLFKAFDTRPIGEVNDGEEMKV